MTRHEIEARLAELDEEIATLQTQAAHGGTSHELSRDLAIRQEQLEAERDRLTPELENFD